VKQHQGLAGGAAVDFVVQYCRHSHESTVRVNWV
jgi:hypothetical protein